MRPRRAAVCGLGCYVTNRHAGLHDPQPVGDLLPVFY